MSGTNIRVIDLPDLGTVTDTSSFVIDKSTTTGRFSALAVKNYCATTTLPEAPSNNVPYGRQNAGWVPVLADAPSNGLPYARLNAAWSPVVPEAPLTGSIYGRGSSGWSSVLPMTGGTVQGSLGATGNITAGGNVYTNVMALSAANSYEWQFYVQGGTGHHIQQHRAGWYDLWASTDGSRYWNGPSGGLMSLTGGGALSIVGGLGVQGDANISHDVIAHAGLFYNGVYVNNAGDPNYFGMFPVGGTHRMQFSDTWYWDWNTSTGTLIWVGGSTSLWVMRRSDNLSFNPSGPVGGNGPYQNVSDRRFKSNIAPATAGLAEIIQLQPMTFDRLPITDADGNPVPRPSEIGFIADDVQPIIPEAVYRTVWPDVGQADPNPSDPALSLAGEVLTAVLVNAVKELNTRLTTLEGKVP